MARIFTTPEAAKAAKVFMHDMLVIGGAGVKNLRTNTPYSWSRSSYRQAAQAISDELTNRDFADINQAITTIADYAFYPNYDNYGKLKSYKPEGVAKAIVYMAELLGLYWDDTIRTPYEISEFQKTLLGEAVYKYGRYISAIPDKTSSRRAASNGTGSNTAGTSRVAASRSPGKPQGPQSGNVRDLQGNPGDKVFADTNYIYKIIADKVGKNTPNVFIKPLNSSGAAGSTNKIFISSGNGWTDCTCYFDDPNDAQRFLDKIVAAGRVPMNINNLRVAKMTAHTNGYFLVGTEFGVVAVNAQTLNEAIKESLREEAASSSCWETATARYTKEELEELYTWMRKD